MNAWNFWLTSFIEIFTTLSPLIVVPVFVGLTGNAPQSEKASLALKSCLIAFAILVLFSLFGMKLLASVGITPAALRIAGGILLFRTGFLLLVSPENKEQSGPRLLNIQSLAVFPMGFPIICGPGSLCIVAAAAERIPANDGHLYSFLLISVITVALVIDFAALVVAPQIVRVLGQAGIEILKRMVGLFVAMLATQLAINGVSEVYRSWHEVQIAK